MEYRGFTLDAFQEQAIRHLESGRSVLVAAPTGTGKTLVADWVVDEALSRGRRVIYTAPIKALSNQKFRDYGRLHGEERVGLVTGDLVIRREAPCLVMTTEILRNMLLGGDGLEDLHAVVIDEIHFLDDRERGTVWEEVLIHLPARVLIVALSATFPNLDDFAQWLTHVRSAPVEVVTETKRAVPLDLYFATRHGGLLTPADFAALARKHGAAPVQDRRARGRGRDRGRDARRDDSERPTQPLDVFRMVHDAGGLPMLYFVFSRRDAEQFARGLAFRFRAELLDGNARDAIDEALKVLGPRAGSALTPDFVEMLRRGVAYHHAGLHVNLKALVEELYERRLIQALFCTSTFALGLNMPARTAVLHGIEKYDGEAVRPLPTRNFMQKAGRAGRRGLDEVGHVVVRMDPSEFQAYRPILERYLNQEYEPVRSSFNLSWNSVVKLLARHDADHIRELVDKSYLQWHLRKASERHEAQADTLRDKLDGARASEAKRLEKEVRRLERRAAEGSTAAWDAFDAKRQFLRRIGYLTADDGFNAGARLLEHLQISEIFMCELLLDGLLEPLDPPTMFGVLCAMTNTMPRTVSRNSPLTRQDRELVTRIEPIRQSEAVRGAEVLTRQEVSWDPDLIPLGRAWAEGEPLDSVLLLIRSSVDWSGSLVTGFRRAKELASQLADAHRGDPHRADWYRDLVRTVSRDEVEVVD
jgi:ATP-dependent RNA helicase HelY